MIAFIGGIVMLKLRELKKEYNRQCFDKDAEFKILGSLLNGHELSGEIFTKLNRNDFSASLLYNLGILFDQIKKVYEDNTPVSVESLKASSVWPIDVTLIKDILNYMPDEVNVKECIDKLLQKRSFREKGLKNYIFEKNEGCIWEFYALIQTKEGDFYRQFNFNYEVTTEEAYKLAENQENYESTRLMNNKNLRELRDKLIDEASRIARVPKSNFDIFVEAN